MIIEICANSFESALAAQEAGADRIELCTELSVGGLTPSYGLIEKVTETLEIPVHVLIRPRSGNFSYTEEELDVMLRDITYCNTIKCAGIVSGGLTKNNEVDIATTEKLIQATGAMQFTYHRAFDWCRDPQKTIHLLAEIGVTRILSSGQQPTALAGIDLLKVLKGIANGQIEIMPGSGINLSNCLTFQEAGFEMIHFSAATKIQTLNQKPLVSMHGVNFFEEGVVATSNRDAIEKIVEKLNG